ncbi:hypothetical protein D3C72_890220 [compost metagenome]
MNIETEGAPFARLTVHSERPVHLLCQAFGDSQPQAGSAKTAGGGSLCLLKRLEQLLLHIRRDTDPGINNTETQKLPTLLLAEQNQPQRNVARMGKFQ